MFVCCCVGQAKVNGATIQLRVYYRTVPDMQHPTPTYDSIALPEYLSSHGITVRTDTPVDVIEPPHTNCLRQYLKSELFLSGHICLCRGFRQERGL